MKIITILLLMISTQIFAEKRGILDNATSGQSTSYFTVEQCNQIANISKRTIKAAISGVPIAEVINKFVYSDFTQFRDDSNLENITIADSAHHSIAEADAITDDYYMGGRITAIYKTVDQIKMKHGQVRPQDRVRLNNRVEQLLLECVHTGTFGILDNGFVID